MRNLTTRRFIFPLLLVLLAVLTASLTYWKVRSVLDGSPGATATGWQGALADEDRHLVTIIPSPPQSEAVSGASFSGVYRGNPDRKQVALTFNGGPVPGATEQLLAILQQYNVKATFFEDGAQATAHADLVRAASTAGQCIALQTASPSSPVSFAQALSAGAITLRTITGQPPHFTRPADGVFNRKMTDAAQALGLRTVFWTADGGDAPQVPADTIATKALTGVENGAILLLHDGQPQTLAALPVIITQLQTRGFALVTLEQMFPLPASKPVKRVAPRHPKAPTPAPAAVGTPVPSDQ